MSSNLPPVLPGPRRIVTSHDSDGKAVVSVDGTVHSSVMIEGFNGHRTGTFWASTDGMPTNDNNCLEDGGARQVGDLGLFASNATNFIYSDLGPGVRTPMHRTPSIDYNILIHGELILITDDGTETHLKNAGDVVIQKGTNHAWRNPGKEWTRWATVLVDAKPAVVNGQELGWFLEMDK